MSASILTSGKIAELIDGRLVGRGDIQIAGVAPLETAGPGDLAFLASSSHLPHFRSSKAGAVLVTAESADEPAGPVTRIVVSDVRLALAQALAALYPEPAVVWGVSPSARIGWGSRWQGRVAIDCGAMLGREVKLGSDCVIGRHAVVEDGTTLGDDCVLEPHCWIGPGAVLGSRVLVRSGARIGGVGFAYAQSQEGHLPVKHVGRCLIEDDVEVGSNAAIDRGSISDTVIGTGTKIDNLVQVAHNVRIGRGCIIMAQAGLAGSTVLEDEVLLAGQAGLAGHLTVGKGARVAAQAGVIGDVLAGATVSGYPARPHREVLRQAAALRKLTRLSKPLEQIVEASVST